MNLAVLSNVNLDMLVQSLKKQHTMFDAEGYGNWIPYALNTDPQLQMFDPKFIFLLLDGNALLETCKTYDEGCVEVRQNLQYVESMASCYPRSIFMVSTLDIRPRRICCRADFGMESLWEAEWLSGLRKIVSKCENTQIFDLNTLLQEAGGADAYSNKMWYMGSIPYSVKTMQKLSEKVNEQIAQYTQVRKKVLIIDLDNTIWGGVAGEDGPGGIILGESLYGAAYRDAQKRIQEIARTGILLAIVSKNNIEDVDAVFEKNPFMVLKKEDFVAILANWKPKAENIRSLASALNLGLDAFVFLDDNPVEREGVRMELPEVSIADFPKDSAALPQAIVKMYEQYFLCWHLTQEDRNKQQQYQAEKLRKESMSKATTMEEYLLSLNIHISMGRVQPQQIGRAVQLLNKTNQFNTNTVRMDRDEFQVYLDDPSHRVYVANVSDRYGDSGLVALLMVQVHGTCAVIEEFLMSCRVMGREIENSIIAALLNHLYQEGIGEVRSSYVRTAKNKPVESLWDRLGFQYCESTENETSYCLELSEEREVQFHLEWQS